MREVRGEWDWMELTQGLWELGKSLLNTTLSRKESKNDNTSNMVADVLQQHKIMLSSSPVGREQKCDAAVDTGWPKVDSWRVERPRNWHQHYESINPTWLRSTVQTIPEQFELLMILSYLCYHGFISPPQGPILFKGVHSILYVLTHMTARSLWPSRHQSYVNKC